MIMLRLREWYLKKYVKVDRFNFYILFFFFDLTHYFYDILLRLHLSANIKCYEKKVLLYFCITLKFSKNIYFGTYLIEKRD